MVKKAPKLSPGSDLEFDAGAPRNAINVDCKCAICGRLVRGTEDAYIGIGIRGGDLIFHPSCTLEVGLRW